MKKGKSSFFFLYKIMIWTVGAYPGPVRGVEGPVTTGPSSSIDAREGAPGPVPGGVFLVPFIVATFPYSSKSLGDSTKVIHPTTETSTTDLCLTYLFLCLGRDAVTAVGGKEPRRVVDTAVTARMKKPLFRSPGSRLVSYVTTF